MSLYFKVVIIKSLIRQNIRKMRDLLPPEYRKEAAQLAAANFLNTKYFAKMTKIAAYHPTNSELDCLPLVQELRKRGGEILLPFIIEDNKKMVFRLWQENEELKNGLYGIKTPNDNAPILTPDLIILPLLAFDKKGARVGYGKGFYDRAITELKLTPVLVGYAYSVQEIEYIESESHDVGLDYVVSEKEVRRF